MSPSSRRRPGRPRAPDLDDRIVDAAFAELGDRGVAGFSLVSVARRAGVAKGTVYLRWPEPAGLIRAALERGPDSMPVPDRGDLRRDLLALCDELVATLAPSVLRVWLRMRAEAPEHPELTHRFERRLLSPGHKAAAAVVHAAQGRGEARRDLDPDVVAEALVSALIVHATDGASPRSPSRAWREQLVAWAVQGLAAT